MIQRFSNKNLQDYIQKSNKDIYTFNPIVTKKRFYHFHLKNEKIWSLLEGIISDKYPAYLKTEESMQQSRKFSGCNMFIMRKELFYEYSKWLFDVLRDFEDKILEYGLEKQVLQEKFVADNRFI